MTRRRIKTTDTLPKELMQSAPRPVALTANGFGVVIAMITLVACAIIAGTLLYQRLSRASEPAGLTDARVIDIRRRDERLLVHYTYMVHGTERRGRTRIHKGARNRFSPGMQVPVQYVLSQPDVSWLQGYGSRSLPFWLVIVVPGLLLLCIVPLVALIRRQAALLREGRATLARVTKTQKKNLGDHNTWRVEYEWKLLSGATHSGRHDSGKNPPPVGASIPIVYDRDNPKRHAPYPLCLVKAVR